MAGADAGPQPRAATDGSETADWTASGDGAAIGIDLDTPATWPEASPFPGMDVSDGGGSAVADFDGDGVVDLYFAVATGPDRIYLSGGHGPMKYHGYYRESEVRTGIDAGQIPCDPPSMRKPGPPPLALVIPAAVLPELEEMARSTTLPHGVVQRAQIVLAGASGRGSLLISREVGCEPRTCASGRSDSAPRRPSTHCGTVHGRGGPRRSA